jgi:hypothetical protein
VTDPENRFHALKFALATPGITATDVVPKAAEYLVFLEGIAMVNPVPVIEDTELADHTESYADEPVLAVEPVEPSPVYIPPEQRGGEPAYYNPYHAKILAQETVLGKIPIVYSEDGTLLPPPADSTLDAAAWKAHHEAFHTRYALSQGQITEPVLEVSVAEIQQDQ